jgi:hypothetical protein
LPGFSCRRAVSFVVPANTARMIASRAWEMWGQNSTDRAEKRDTTIVIWQGRRGLVGQASAPTGSFSITWDRPVVDQASITRIEWDPSSGGSEDVVRQAINSLAGWPVARGFAAAG